MKKLNIVLLIVTFILTMVLCYGIITKLIQSNVIIIDENRENIDILAREVINRVLMYPARDELITLLVKLNNDFALELNSIYKPSNWDIFYENIYTLISIYLHSFVLIPNNVHHQTASDYFNMLLASRDHLYYNQVNQLITRTLHNLISSQNIPNDLLHFLQNDSAHEKYKPLWNFLITK